MLPLPAGSATPATDRALAEPADHQDVMPVPATPAPAPPVHLGSIAPYALHFDADMQRFILEARDPVTGLVIFQMPPKSAFRELEASAAARAPAQRGGSLNKSA